MLNKWSRLRIEELCECLDNRRIPIAKDKREAGSVPYYGATGIVDYVKNSIFDERLLLVGEDGADWSANANTSYIIDGKSWVNNHAHVLKCTKINEIYLNAYLNFADLTNYINGTTRGKLTKNDLLNINVPVPSVPVQQKIASILSTVDEEIQKTDQTIDKTRLLKDGLLSKFLGEGKYKLHKLEDLCEIIADCPHTTPKYEPDGKYLVVRTPNVRDGKLNLSEALYTSEDQYLERTKKMMPTPGDVLLTREAPAGEACLVPKNPILCLGQRMMCVRADKLKLLPEFLIYSVYSPVLSKIFKGKSSGTTVSHFNVSDIRKLTIPTPPLDTQKEIIETLSAIDKKLDLEEHSKKSLIDLKNGLMNDFFSQKVEVKL
jgi:type I restriction enzyme S subunit